MKTLHGILGTFGSVPLMFFQDKRVASKSNCLKAYVSVQSFQGTNDDAFPSVEKIAERVSMTDGAARAALHILEKTGWIKITKRPGHSSIYRCLTYYEPAEDFEVVDKRTGNGDAERFTPSKEIAVLQKDCIPHPSKEIAGVGSKNIGAIQAQVQAQSEKPIVDRPPLRRVTDTYQLHYMRERDGAKPAWGAKTAELIKRDLARVGTDRLLKLVGRFFINPPPAVAEFRAKAGMEYGVFHSQIDKLLAANHDDKGDPYAETRRKNSEGYRRILEMQRGLPLGGEAAP